MENCVKGLFCEPCSLTFDKKVWYDIHLKIIHGTKPMKTKPDGPLICETEAKSKSTVINEIEAPPTSDKKFEQK